MSCAHSEVQREHDGVDLICVPFEWLGHRLARLCIQDADCAVSKAGGDGLAVRRERDAADIICVPFEQLGLRPQIVPSQEPEMIRFPLGKNATELMLSVCPLNGLDTVPASQTWIAWPRELETMRLPSEMIATEVTVLVRPLNGLGNTSPVSASQTWIMWSEPEMIRLPPGENATHWTLDVCPLSSLDIALPVSASRTDHMALRSRDHALAVGRERDGAAMRLCH